MRRAAQLRFIWRHKKRGTLYRVIAKAQLQASGPVADGDDMVVYMSLDGRFFVRSVSEFSDGRFEKACP